MSYIAFHFPDGTESRISGPERAHFGYMTENHAKGSLGLVYAIRSKGYLHSVLVPFINPGGWVGEFLAGSEVDGFQFDQVLGNALATMSFRSGPSLFAWKGVEINTRQLILNTVLATGSDPMRLAVKLHFQCEIHGYVMGFHRKWLADIVDEGLAEGIYRRDMGWEELSARLREANQGPVVTSASVAESFPNMGVANWQGSQEEWERLDDDKQWAQGVKGLKAPGRNRPWAPDTLRAYRFGHDLSLLDLLRGDTERIEKGLKIE